MTTRGERNLNPTNLDYHEAIKWQGQVGIETGVPNPRFAVFSDIKFGLRAPARQLLTNQTAHGAHTVRAQINLWAPPAENNTSAYVEAVSFAVWGASGHEDDEIDVDSPDTMTKMLKAIVQHENGENIYTDAQFAEAINLAGVAGAPPPKLSAQKPFVAKVGAATAMVSAGVAQLSSSAPTVKGWADQLSAYTGSPIVQHVVTVLITVAGGLTVLSIVYSMIDHKKATP